jgi:hypothetical protein
LAESSRLFDYFNRRFGSRITTDCRFRSCTKGLARPGAGLANIRIRSATLANQVRNHLLGLIRQITEFSSRCGT